MARLSFEERREEILRATLRVIARRGFSATTTRDVTAEAGVTHGLLHHYFPARDELLAAAFDLAANENLTELRADLAKVTTPLDRLRRFLRFYGPTGADPLFALWLDAWSESARNEVLRETANRLNRGWIAELAGIVQAGIDDGSFACEDADDAAWVIMSLLDGLAIQVTVRGGVGPRRVQRLVRAHVEEQLGLSAGALR